MFIKQIVSFNSGKSHSTNDSNFIVLNEYDDLDSFHDKVVLYSSWYHKIFKIYFSECGNTPWKRGIVKIKSGSDPKKMRTIYRMFQGSNLKGVEKNIIGLTGTSMNILDNPKEVLENNLSKGSKFCFYWQHPQHYVRVSFKLGVVSVLLTIVSLVIGILF